MCTYQRHYVMVNWNGECFSTYSIGDGVKQGRVLSTVLFTVNLDGIIDEIEKKSLGYHFNGHFLVALYMQMLLLFLSHLVRHCILC